MGEDDYYVGVLMSVRFCRDNGIKIRAKEKDTEPKVKSRSEEQEEVTFQWGVATLP